MNNKLKPVLPSLREKKRYLVFEIISKEAVKDIVSVSRAIMGCSLKLLGHLGVAKAGIIILENKWNPALQRGIIKVSRKHIDAVKSALIFGSEINNTNIIFRTIGISGILKKAEARYLKAAS